MADWGIAFDEQCRSEGLEVPEKTEKVQSGSEMDQNEENKGSNGWGISRGGMFGGPKASNAPPPQTSFGSTSGTRVGGSFGGQAGVDGRGAPLGSAEELIGGGNIISVGIHKEKPACKRGGGFGTNRSMAPCPPAIIKNNHEGGRFGVLAPRTLSGSIPQTSTNLEDSTPKTSTGGRFGASISQGGAFGAKTQSSSVAPSVGGGFGVKSPNIVSNDMPKVPVMKSVGGGFGSSMKSPATTGGSFGSSTVVASIRSEESFGIKSSASAGGSFNSSSASASQSRTVASFGSKPSNENISSNSSALSSSSSCFAAKPTSTSAGGSFGNQPSSFSSKPSFGGAFGASTSVTGSSSMGGSFGNKSTKVPDVESLSPPEILRNPSNTSGGAFGSKPSFAASSSELPANKHVVGGGFGRSTAPTVNTSVGNESGRLPFVETRNPNTEQETSSSVRPYGANFNSKSEPAQKNPFGGNSSSTKPEFKENEMKNSSVPIMPGQSQPMRGGFQGAYRGGRGSGGGQMDFGAPGQGQSMGRGRGQQNPAFVPRPRDTPPQYGGHQAAQQFVKPDSKYKFTKPATEEAHEQVPVPADIALLNKFIQKEVKMMKDVVVDVQRQDPKSPLYSISSFRELRLKPEVLKALDTMNFQFPTRIQETALPLLLMEPPSNLIAQAQSGTGKTAAFVLTMLCRIDVNLMCPQCICLAPTLELAKQIGEVVEKMGKFIDNLKIHYAIKGGNMAAMRGRKLTEQIVIGTPGITRDYLQKYKCIDPSKIRCLVLDEADVMIYHQGFTDISTTIYNMVEDASDSVQSMLFSATYDEPVINFATKIIKNAIVVMLKREEQALPNIKQFYVQCACRDSKYAAIVNLYSGLAVASSVIFCHTKASVMWLYENMRARGHQVDVLHGDMTVVERADTIIHFKRGDFKVLITTNVFARGIDVAQVSVVINYDLPIKYTDEGTPMVVDGFTQPDCETYLHRIGRTGRFGKTGIAINLIDSEDSMNMINVLENHFQMKIARMDPSNLVELEAIEMA
ncbi:RNA helicase [Caenorhabditis elegans]|uniref:RNA helicase n=2 Tax=Caenorhabditis elegans TaxID=6239 RepID=Q22308_CAEEL|nr:RNA helicase [Caenorhabditis elegans]CAA90408.1 RNA helicase [Caenorhabditis elegans]|eukprot:NP_495891.1 DEAD boX helicase homolog [Caenorhabditis elegans]